MADPPASVTARAGSPVDYGNSWEDRRYSSLSNSEQSITSSTESQRSRTASSIADETLSKRSIGCIRVSFLNIILMGLGFMLNIGVFNTAGMAQTVVLSTVNTTDMVGYSTLGYNLFAVMSGSQAIAYLLGPAVVAITGPKLGMVLGAACVTFYLGSFIRPTIPMLYIGALLVGFGAGIIWTVQGFFVTINSTSKRVLRNTGVFWILYTSSFVTGNLFYFFMVRGDAVMSNGKREVIFSVLTGASAVGVLVFACVVHPWTEKIPRPQEDILTPKSDRRGSLLLLTTARSPKEAFFATVKFTFRKDILILMPMFFYIGIEATFWGSVYVTSLGYTHEYGNHAQSLVGLSGVFAGVGEIIGGIVLGLLGRWMHFNGKDRALLVGMVLHIVACYLTFLNTAPQACLAMTTDADQPPYIGPNPILAMFISFLFGLGDAIWNSQMMAYLGEVYRQECVSVFAVYQFWCAIASAAAFVYATVLTLEWQLLILIGVSIPSAAGFCWVEWESLRRHLPVLE